MTHLTAHVDEKPFKCEICSKQFRELAHLKGHLQTNTKEKLFECNIYRKPFTCISRGP